MSKENAMSTPQPREEQRWRQWRQIGPAQLARVRHYLLHAMAACAAGHEWHERYQQLLAVKTASGREEPRHA